MLEPGAAHPTIYRQLHPDGRILLLHSGYRAQALRRNDMASALVACPDRGRAGSGYMCYGARLYGWQTGLAAGGLVALSAWNLTLAASVLLRCPQWRSTWDLRVRGARAADRTARLLCGGRGACGAGVAAILCGAAGAFCAWGGAGAHCDHAAETCYTGAGHGHRDTRDWCDAGISAGGPLTAIQQPEAFSGRVDQVSIFNPQVNKGDPDALSEHEPEQAPADVQLPRRRQR